MEESEKRRIIYKLDDKKYWRRYYSVANRRWFIRTIINYLLSKSRPENIIEAETTEIIAKAKVLVSDRIKTKASGPGDLKKYWDDKTDGVSLRQIIYNMIALHPEFLDAGHKDYLNFIIDRRIRMVKRMQYFVNPNSSRMYFLYPGSIPFVPPPEGISLVNNEAKEFWKGLVNISGFITKPFVLTTKGKLNPFTAVSKIFDKSKGSNFFYCDDVLGILMMDSLLSGNNPNKLLKLLDAEGEEHFKIDHPYHHYGTFSDRTSVLLASISKAVNAGTNIEIQVGNSFGFYEDSMGTNNERVGQNKFFTMKPDIRYLIAFGDHHEIITPLKVNFQTKILLVKKVINNYPIEAKIYLSKNYPPPNDNKPYPTYHFMNDSRPEKTYFEQVNVNLRSLQVGDIVKALNHSLYQRYINVDSAEENSVVMEMAVHSINNTVFDQGLKLAGHGMSGKNGAGYSIKQMVTELLDKVNTVIDVFTHILPIHLKNFHTNGTADSDIVKVKTKTVNGNDYNFFEYDINVKSKLYGDLANKEWTFNGFVIRQLVTNEKKFTVYNINTKDSLLPQNTEVQVSLFPRLAISNLDDISFIGDDAEFSSMKGQFSKWGIRYLDKTAMKARTQFLFEKDDKTPKRLSFDNLKRERSFLYSLDNDRDVFAIRPKIDFGSNYQTFLKNTGALP